MEEALNLVEYQEVLQFQINMLTLECQTLSGDLKVMGLSELLTVSSLVYSKVLTMFYVDIIIKYSVPKIVYSYGFNLLKVLKLIRTYTFSRVRTLVGNTRLITKLHRCILCSPATLRNLYKFYPIVNNFIRSIPLTWY